ncbi:MAG: hypothetical protein WCI22_16820, partial [Actinomycetota bacterium]
MGDDSIWITAGLYNANGPFAAQRLELLEWLSTQGISVDAMIAEMVAVGSGPVSVAYSSRWPSGAVTTNSTASLARMSPSPEACA